MSAKKSVFFYFLCLVILLNLVNAGCGGDKNNGNPGSSSSAPTTTSHNDYGQLGNYQFKRFPESGLQNNYVVYHPIEITPQMPVVLFLEGGGNTPKIDDYRGVMKYLASWGYFVIGAESGQSYDTDYALGIFENAIGTAIDVHHLEVSKLAVMGHSQGGGQAFYVMKKLREKGYGSTASIVISIDGWFAFNMNKSDLHNLDSRIAFIQMNGLEGTGTDPRINLSIWKLAHMSKKFFLTLSHDNHSYVAGSLQTLLTQRSDILTLIGALTNDAFNGRDSGYESIAENYKVTFDDVFNALKPTYPYDCKGVVANAKIQLVNNDIDYCAMTP